MTDELVLESLEQAAGGTLSGETQYQLVQKIHEAKMMGCSMETLVTLFSAFPEAVQFIKENWWWVRSD